MVDNAIVLRLNQIHSMSREKVVKIDSKCNRKCKLDSMSTCSGCGRHIDEIVKAGTSYRGR